MIWKQRFPYALQYYLKSVHGIQSTSEEDTFKHIRDLDNQQRRGIWAVISEILDILPQDAHDYFHNTWTKQFFDPIDLIKKELAEIVMNNVDAAETRKELLQITLAKIQEHFPDKNFHTMSIKQHLYHQINKTTKFGAKQKNKQPKQSENDDQQHILKLVKLFLTEGQ